MSRKRKGYSGIVGYDPDSGKTTIAYNGVRFYTKDKSVIKLAQKGDFEQAARRWAGKTSTARAIRQVNKASTKPIYENPQRALFKKMFTSEKKERIGTSAAERLKFAKEYKEVSKEVSKYIDQAVTDKMPADEYMDKLPEDLQQRIKRTISTEVEKCYKDKGEVDDNDIEQIYDRVTTELNDYIIEQKENLKSLTGEEYEALQGILNNIEKYAAIPYSEVSGLSRV